MKIFSLFMLISLVMISSCLFKNASIKKDIQTLQSQKINFPNGMLKYIPNKRTFEPESNVIIARKKLSWIVYVDSTECTTCSYGLIYKWDNILEKYKKQVQFNFIFVPRQSDEKLTLIALKEINSEHYLWIDREGQFEKLNPHLPKNKVLHTFLLDENNNVFLVGKPLHNKKIEKMFYKIVEDKLGKPQ